MAPITDKSVWLEVKSRYQSGSYKSVTSLAQEFGINHFTLRTRIDREGWSEKREQLLQKVSEKVEGKVLSMAEEVLNTGYVRSKRFQAIIDASIGQLGTNEAGVPLAEPADIDNLSKAEVRIHDWQKSCARIAPVAQQIDHKGSVSIEHSLVSVISKLREANTAIDITPEQLSYIKSCEVEKPSQ